jgi:hypothetical protein
MTGSDEHEHDSGQGQPSAADTGSAVGKDELAGLLSDIARSLEQQGDSEAMLVRMVQEAIAVIPGVEEGVSVW